MSRLELPVSARAARAFGRGPQHPVQIFACAGDAGADRADRAVADRRGLGVGAAEQLGGLGDPVGRRARRRVQSDDCGAQALGVGGAIIEIADD